MGQVIAGRFELIAPLAGGGQGTVWLAHDRVRGRRCAAKVLAQADSAALLRFVREQGVQVDHPHLASPYGWAAADHEVAIAMPLVAGGSLEGALADHGPLSEPLVACVLLQVLDGLAALHAAGWVHRDVKPANVLLEPTGTGEPHARLGDMGLAIRADDPRLTMAGLLPGTPGYVSPEAAAGAGPDPAQDLWAAGATAARLLRPEVELDGGPAVDDVLAAVASSELAAVLGRDGLLSADPAQRRSAAAAAPDTLAGLARSALPSGGHLTAAGEPFEVFDHTADHGLDDLVPAAAPHRDVTPASPPVAPATPRTPAAAAAAPVPAAGGPVAWPGVVLLILGGLALLVALLVLVL